MGCSRRLTPDTSCGLPALGGPDLSHSPGPLRQLAYAQFGVGATCSRTVAAPGSAPLGWRRSRVRHSSRCPVHPPAIARSPSPARRPCDHSRAATGSAATLLPCSRNSPSLYCAPAIALLRRVRYLSRASRSFLGGRTQGVLSRSTASCCGCLERTSRGFRHLRRPKPRSKRRFAMARTARINIFRRVLGGPPAFSSGYSLVSPHIEWTVL
jgi:hypothetical protein